MFRVAISARSLRGTGAVALVLALANMSVWQPPSAAAPNRAAEFAMVRNALRRAISLPGFNVLPPFPIARGNISNLTQA